MNGGEQRIDVHYVDGFNAKNNVIYEFMGCLWHGCAKCFLPDTMNPVNDTGMEDLLEGTIRKVERLKRLGYRVEVKWECEFKQELVSNPDKGLKFDTFPHCGVCTYSTQFVANFAFRSIRRTSQLFFYFVFSQSSSP